ncbi:hypothetical protein H0484_03850 [Pusillimonas sp. CC-YST705]|uniref:SPOR domain-containing protein n=1 Tax=Mesopusillimonas faecipullorum TaxID=2755040 RepID=A0ABS8CB88_9BURK|nr:hypothetical protein [Mesopusillimonas faecipullorum]MCB5362889.1 hypothetical protein [Mesopusillimonas faecipullorum]
MKQLTPIAAMVLTVLTALTPGLANSADNVLYEHAQQLQSEQQAPQFSIGNTVYQFVPQASVVASPPASANQPAVQARSASPSTGAVSQIGPYAIVLNSQANRLSARTATSKRQQYAVVVNMTSGLPSLMLPQLQLVVREAGHGADLARALGGTLLFDGDVSRVVVIGFDSHDAALQALPEARALENVVSAQPPLQRRFRTGK